MTENEYHHFLSFWVDIHEPKTITNYITCLKACPSKETIDATEIPFKAP
jgi:hypothetical protein